MRTKPETKEDLRLSRRRRRRKLSPMKSFFTVASRTPNQLNENQQQQQQQSVSFIRRQRSVRKSRRLLRLPREQNEAAVKEKVSF